MTCALHWTEALLKTRDTLMVLLYVSKLFNNISTEEIKSYSFKEWMWRIYFTLAPGLFAICTLEMCYLFHADCFCICLGLHFIFLREDTSVLNHMQE